MTTHETDTDLILFLSAEELEAYDLTSEQLTGQQMLSFLRTYLSQMQKTLPLHPEIELFSSKAGLLVFVRPSFTYSPNFPIYQKFFS